MATGFKMERYLHKHYRRSVVKSCCERIRGGEKYLILKSFSRELLF